MVTLCIAVVDCLYNIICFTIYSSVYSLAIIIIIINYSSYFCQCTDDLCFLFDFPLISIIIKMCVLVIK